MSKEGKINRGKKWDKLALLSEKAKTSIEADPNKMADVNFYKESMKSTDKGKVDIDWSIKSKKELELTCDSLAIKRTDAKTKDDLIVLLEAFSDSEPKEA